MERGSEMQGDGGQPGAQAGAKAGREGTRAVSAAGVLDGEADCPHSHSCTSSSDRPQRPGSSSTFFRFSGFSGWRIMGI